MDTANTQAASANIRLRWNYRPDSDLYVIYTAGQRFASLEVANPMQLWIAGAGTGLWFIPEQGEARQIAPGSRLPLKFVSYIAVIGHRLLLVDKDAGRSFAIAPAELLASGNSAAALRFK